MVYGTVTETCRAICPYSKTKIFFGSEIGGAIVRDGQHYAELETAFVYRKQLVANSPVTVRMLFCLTSFSVKNNPTLRPGDIVSTAEGTLGLLPANLHKVRFSHPSVRPCFPPIYDLDHHNCRFLRVRSQPPKTSRRLCRQRNGNLRAQHPTVDVQVIPPDSRSRGASTSLGAEPKASCRMGCKTVTFLDGDLPSHDA
jgi:hypothetical protein